MASCAPTRIHKSVYFVDYSFYDNFFITESNSVSFEYKPIGSIGVSLTGYEEINNKPTVKESLKTEREDDIYYSNDSNTGVNYSIYNPTLEDAIEIVVSEVKNKGGNGIINFKCEIILGSSSASEGWFVSGMAIKK